jgi:hypothetical protein
MYSTHESTCRIPVPIAHCSKPGSLADVERKVLLSVAPIIDPSSAAEPFYPTTSVLLEPSGDPDREAGRRRPARLSGHGGGGLGSFFGAVIFERCGVSDLIEPGVIWVIDSKLECTIPPRQTQRLWRLQSLGITG